MSAVWTLPTNRQPTEHEEQRDFVRWFRRAYPSIRIFAIPNGGERDKSAAMKFKLEGVSRGVPDLYVPAWRLWIEMKRQDGGVVSEDQKDWHLYLKDIGDTVIICRGSVEAQDMVTNLFSHQKEAPKP